MGIETNIRFAKSIDEMAQIIRWCAQEGWSVQEGDEALYWAQDSGACLLLELCNTENEEKIIVAGIFLAKLDRDLTWLGAFIVDPQFRGKGYGKELWDSAMEKICSPMIGLYAVSNMRNKYERSGFREKYRVKRWEGHNLTHTTDVFSEGEELVRIDPRDISLRDSIFSYAQGVFPGLNLEVYFALFAKNSASGFVLCENAKIIGVGIIRPCALGCRVGPLYADSVEGAQKLFARLLEKLEPTKTIILDSPEVNTRNDFMEGLGLTHVSVSDTYAMFCGEEPSVLLAQLIRNFAAFSLETG